jgi:nucleotide-binding universal stress UspA family protein
VLIVPAGGREPAPNIPPRRILVPLDGSVRGECALPTALRLARTDDAQILLAHVIPDPIRTEVLSTADDLALAHQLADRLTARAHDYLDRIRSQLVAGGARARAVVNRATDHREGLVTLASAERADLVVLSAHGSVCNPRRRFGSVTSHLIAHSTAPVLVIQDLPESASLTPRTRTSRPPPRSFDAAPGGS